MGGTMLFGEEPWKNPEVISGWGTATV